MILTRLFSSMLFCFVCFIVNVQAAPLINGDFTSFDGWSGDKGDFFGGTVTTLVGEAELADDANFNHANRATLTNDATNFGVSLYQLFDLSAEASLLSVDYSWVMSDASSDSVSAVLLNSTTFDIALNLFQSTDTFVNTATGSLTIDVSSLMAGEYQLEFSLIDGDFNETDSLHIANIAVVNASAIPVPPTLLLFLSGIMGIFPVRTFFKRT